MEENKSKQCTKCLEFLELTKDNFYKSNYTKDGFEAWCKTCKKEYQRKYIEDNREDVNKRKIVSRLKNPEKAKQMIKNWTENNIDRHREYQKEWQQSDEGKKIMSIHSRNRSKEKKHEIKNKEWIECKKYFNNSCAYCELTNQEHKEKFGTQLHKEHYDPNGSNKIDNCVPSCVSCNSTKREVHGDEWFSEGNPHFTKEKRDRIVRFLESKTT